MAWRSTRTCKVVVAVCLLAACSDTPTAPEPSVVLAERPLSGHPGAPATPRHPSPTAYGRGSPSAAYPACPVPFRDSGQRRAGDKWNRFRN